MQIVDGYISTIQNSISLNIHFNFSVPKYMFVLYDMEHGIPTEFIREKKTKSIIEYLRKV